MAIIKTPVEGWTGESASVWFSDGVAETTDPELIAWFTEKGYIIEDDKTTKSKTKGKAKATENPYISPDDESGDVDA